MSESESTDQPRTAPNGGRPPFEAVVIRPEDAERNDVAPPRYIIRDGWRYDLTKQEDVDAINRGVAPPSAGAQWAGDRGRFVTPLEVVRTIRAEILNNPQRWIKGVHAEDLNGRPVEPTDPTARRWSLYGAIYPAGGSRLQEDEFERLVSVMDHEAYRLAGRLGRRHLGYTAFNDAPQTTFDDIHALLRQVEARLTP
jgi:hypothetical protein